MRSAAAATWCVRSRAARSRGSAPRPGGAWRPWGRRPGAADVRIGIGAQVGILGGPGTYARALAGALAAAGGHEYVVFTDRPEAFAGLGVETVHVPLASPYHQAAWDHWRLPGLAAEGRLDLYHGTKNVLPWRLAAPAVVTVHDLAVYAAPETFAWAQRWHLRLLLPRAMAGRLRPGYAPPWLVTLPPGVRWLGPLPPHALGALYAAAEIAVSASEYEGFGLTVCEAMASGCAVVAVATSALPEVVGDAGVLVARSEPALLADALARLAAEPETRAALGAAARARAARFTWEETARQTRRVYEEVLGCA